MEGFSRRVFVGGAASLVGGYALGFGRLTPAFGQDAVRTPLEAFIVAIPDSDRLLLEQGWLYFPSEALTRASSAGATLTQLLGSPSADVAELGEAGGSTFDATWPYRTSYTDARPDQQRRIVLFALSGETQPPADFESEFGGRKTPAADEAAQDNPELPSAPDDASGWTAGIAAVVDAVQIYLSAANAPPEPEEENSGSADGGPVTDEDLDTLGYDEDPEQ